MDMRGSRHALRTLWMLRRLIVSEKPDIVQCWMYHSDLLGGVAARLAGHSRIVWGIRTTDLVRGSSRVTAVLRRVCALLSHFVPRLIVCAAEAARRAHAADGYDTSRMIVIPNGFDTSRSPGAVDDARQLRLQYAIESGAVVIGCVSRFNVYKDLRTFVQAAGKVAAQRADVRILMVGLGLDASNPTLASWVEETGCSRRFVLLGERSDVPACLAAMDIFCLSSRSEGLPNAVAEAMAMEVPCVVTDVGDAAMLVADTGLIVPREEPTALASALSTMADMPRAARQDLGRRARRRIERDFSVAAMHERYDAAYAAVMSGKVLSGVQVAPGTE